jgi:protein-tyrosine phosphatase
MASIIVVCTGNVCRSPIAEGLLRSILQARFGDAAPSVASAGTAGWVGSGADPDSIRTASELGIDISAHRARQLRADEIRSARLVLAMAGEHREAAARSVPEAGRVSFALKELVGLLEALPEASPTNDPTAALVDRVREADRLRRDGTGGRGRDDGIADPLGMPLDGFRAVASDLEAWCARLADGLFGRARARTAAAAERE